MALTLLTRITRAVERLGELMGEVAGWVYVVCSLFITFDVISRRFLGFNSQATTEISSYLLAFGIAWGLAHALTSKGHIRVDVFIQRLPPRPRAVMHLLALVLLAVVGWLFARRSFDVVSESVEFNARDISALSIPLVVPQGLWSFGIWVFFVLVVLRLLQTALLLIAGRYEVVNEQLGPRSIEEETEEALEASGVVPAHEPGGDRPARREEPVGPLGKAAS
jgi:TRAP-type C4-dicarboxylate transport system permease small subunit